MKQHPRIRIASRTPEPIFEARRKPGRNRRQPGHALCGAALALLGAWTAAGQTSQPATDVFGLVRQLLSNPGNDVASSPWSAAPEPEPLPESGEVHRTDTGLLDVHVRDMELQTVLEMLALEARANIVATPSVSGRVTASLYGVSLADALEALLVPNKFGARTVGRTIFVGRPEELLMFQPPPVTRVVRLRYLQAAEAGQAVQSILGEKAAIVEGTAAREGGGTRVGEMGPTGSDYLIITAQPEQLDQAEELLRELDQRPRQVLIEATILRATLNETNQFGMDFTVLSGVDFETVASISNAGADVRTGPLPPSEFQETTVNLNTQFNQNVSAGGFTFGIIHNNLGVFIRALEEITDVVVVANPKIVALNRQDAQVIVGRRDGYLTTTVTETAAVQTVQFLETGTQVRFRPVINDDGTVRLVVHPKDSNGGLTSANLPFEETTEAQSDILVEDGHTVLIGGLFRERTVGSRSQVPLVGDIPGLGLLLSSQTDRTVREEVIILLTVHILRETPEEARQFEELRDDIERLRVGLRQHLLGIGRERIAQAFYREAVRRLAEGHAGLALFNARMTVLNQPQHQPAMKMIERLTEQRLWDEEGTRMRTWIWELIQSGDRKSPRPWSSEDDEGPGPLPPPEAALERGIFGRPELRSDSEDTEIHR